MWTCSSCIVVEMCILVSGSRDHRIVVLGSLCVYLQTSSKKTFSVLCPRLMTFYTFVHLAIYDAISVLTISDRPGSISKFA